MNKTEKEQAARSIAAEGMVLLKNEESTLPFSEKDKIAFVGNGIFDYQKGGLGSADVMTGHNVNIVEGMSKKAVRLSEKSLTKQKNYDLHTLNELAKDSTCALAALTRISSEGGDRNDFNLSEEEKELFCRLEESDFERIAVVLNIGGIINIAQLGQYKKIKAVLLIWQAGMQGGNAAADILCGDVNPCGKLSDTVAYSCSDYPSASFFGKSYFDVYYSEDIFVGYRYFETFARDKVLYPFGYGLSYTEFEYQNCEAAVSEDMVTVRVDVKNTGKREGKEIVQIYSSSPEGKLKKPAAELRAYDKTRLLKPGETQTLCMKFPVSDMSCFDERQAAYILEKGTYKIYAGSNVREIRECGTYTVEKETVTEKTTLKFTMGTPYKINDSGEFVRTNIYDATEKSPQKDEFDKRKKREEENAKSENKYSLYDVSEGKFSLKEFIESLPDETLINLAQAQPPAFVRGTGGIGNAPEFGIPNPQTSDGPAGVRTTVPTTALPCATLLACTWDEAIQEKTGDILGDECVEHNIDILLAPGLNIHRNPLCGRNFEYYSEDPLLAGKSAAAVVRGVQKNGVGATVKHFALNNCETNRKDSNSVVSERALREIYLKGFRIAVKEGKPWCLMTSYNLLNGLRTSSNYNLLTGIVREEWDFDGLIMTDWRVLSHLWEETAAGGNVKMPFGYPEEIALLRDYYSRGLISREQLEKNAGYVLKTVMKTRRFKDKNFGTVHKLNDDKETVIRAVDFTGTSTTWAGSRINEDGSVILDGLGLDMRGSETFVYYKLACKNQRRAVIGFEVSCIFENMTMELSVNGCKTDTLPLPATDGSLDKMQMIYSSETELTCGINELKIDIKNGQNMNCVNIGRIIIS